MFGGGEKSAEVAQIAATRRRPRRQAAGCQSQAARREDDVRVTTAFNRLLGLPGASVIDVGFGGEGVIVTRPAAPPPARVRALRADRPPTRHPRSPRQALAPPGSRLDALRDRVRAAAAQMPGLPRRPGRAGAVGAAGRPSHPRLRRRRRVAGAADGQDPDHQADADRLGHHRDDRRACRLRPSG